jgi:hypothetical protein
MGRAQLPGLFMNAVARRSNHRPPGLLSSTAGVGVLAVRRGGAEREKASREKIERLATASMD